MNKEIINKYVNNDHLVLEGGSKKPIAPEGLDEAADAYAERHGFRVPYDGTNNFYDEVDVKASKDGFKAGAEWAFGQGETHEGVVGNDFIIELDKGDWIDLTPDVSNQPSFDVKPGDKVIVQIRKK